MVRKSSSLDEVPEEEEPQEVTPESVAAPAAALADAFKAEPQAASDRVWGRYTTSSSQVEQVLGTSHCLRQQATGVAEAGPGQVRFCSDLSSM